MQKKNRKECRLTTDMMAVSIYNNLLSDFRSVHPFFAPDATTMRLGVPTSYRQLGLPDYRSTLTKRFRAYYQLDNLLKKYRFQDDPFTPAELEKVTYEKYNTFQCKRSTYGIVPYRATLVVREARKIAKEILGDFSWDDVMPLCRFGRNSSVGCNFANAYLDHKLSAPEAFTGTVSAQKFFEDYLKKDPLLAKILKGKLVCLHEVLPLITVPKKYDIDRLITPLTLIGLFLSYGLGRLVEERLKLHPIAGTRTTLNIRRLQDIHRHVIRKYSCTRSHATLDMSYGSENITSWLLNMILPRKWYTALKMTFCRRVSQNGVIHYTESVLPMGNGATFPVETLIFYCLIRAIGNLAKVPGRYSVYGDDVIVPSQAYAYTLDIFSDLGIAVNRTKSFNREHFRESCGADFYNGAAVRPFYMPEGVKFSRVSDRKYTVWLYKCMNGLLARWAPEEIPNTLRSIFMELVLSTSGKVLLVPPSFPETAGVQWADPVKPPLLCSHNWSLPVAVYKNGTRQYTFNFLLEVPHKRVALSSVSYYWDSLRSGTTQRPVVSSEFALFREGVPSFAPEDLELRDDWRSLVLNDYLRFIKYISPPTLTYRRVVRRRSYISNGVVRLKERVKWLPLVSDKQRSAFEIRRVGDKLPRTQGEDPIISDWI